MSLMQGGIAIGIMVGYVVAGLFYNLSSWPETTNPVELRLRLMAPVLVQVRVCILCESECCRLCARGETSVCARETTYILSFDFGCVA